MLVPTDRSVILCLGASPDLHRPSCKIDEDGVHGADGDDISKENEGSPQKKYSTYGVGNGRGASLHQGKARCDQRCFLKHFPIFDPGIFVILIFQLLGFRCFF